LNALECAYDDLIARCDWEPIVKHARDGLRKLLYPDTLPSEPND